MTILDDILCGILAALLIALCVLLVVNANLRADLASAHANSSALSAANAELSDKALQQNQLIDGLQKTESERALHAVQAVEAAQSEAKRYADLAAAIAKPSPEGADDYASARKILSDYLENSK